ncbi:MAG: RNA methyltransferase [Bacteroidota bacterium]
MQALSKAKLRLFRSLRGKKQRQKERLFTVEGEKLVQEALNSQFEVKGVVLREDVQERYLKDLLFQESQIQNLPLWLTSSKDYREISTLENSEGILAVIRLPKEELRDTLPVGPGFILDTLQDPGNVGTILRIADWFGMPNVLFTQGTVDLWNPKTLRASMGAIFRIKPYRIKNEREFILRFASRIWLADMEGVPLPKSQMKWEDFILLGNEAQGLSPHMKEDLAHRRVSIPGFGGAESLNVSVAAGILAYELCRDRERE